jgi:hypothetical protein
MTGASSVRPLMQLETELAATLARILTAPNGDERRDVRRIEKFIRDIVKRELKEIATNG